MSRIFKIFGNFMQFVRWSSPDPSFSGKIVVDDADEFYGICEELYDSSASDIERTTYIAGAFAANNQTGQRGIAFYKLSNDPGQPPLMYVTPDLTNPESGSWAVLSFTCFQEQGRSRITIEEEVFSEEKANEIKAKYEHLRKDINHNGDLLPQIQCCKDLIIHAAKH